MDAKKQFQRYERISKLIWPLILVLAVLTFTGIGPFFITIPILIVLVILEFIVLPRKQNALNAEVEAQKQREQEELLLPLLRESFEVEGFLPDQWIDRPETLVGRSVEKVGGSCLLTGKYQGMSFTFSNLFETHTETSGIGTDEESHRRVDFGGIALCCDTGKTLTEDMQKQMKKLVKQALPANVNIEKFVVSESNPGEAVILVDDRMDSLRDDALRLFLAPGGWKEENELKKDIAFLENLLDAVKSATEAAL